MSDLSKLQALGQSVWLDYILRSYVQGGEFSRDVARGVRGVTSNPSIFEQAIGKSADYDEQIGCLAAVGADSQQIYEELALKDIRLAAAELRAVYDATHGLDGYVSLEVSPDLAHDTQGTIREALHLFGRLGLPNIMIKVPGTVEGVAAIEELIYRGVNVNVTLLFSLTQYRRVAEAYLRGLERRGKEGRGLHVRSVASFFVSRLDSLLDPRLEAIGGDAAALRGQAAVANAKLAYQEFLTIFQGDRFKSLRDAGAAVQRPLWASTSTKNPAYRDVMYVEELVGPDTVNTLPPKTLQAFVDHGSAEVRITRGITEAQALRERLKAVGLDLEDVGEELQVQGVAAFQKAFEALHQEIQRKADALVPGERTAHLGDLTAPAGQSLQILAAEDIPRRLKSGDTTLFVNREVAAKRLGWLKLPQEMRSRLEELRTFREDLQGRGIRRLILVGMGGSSLFPDVLRRMVGASDLRLDVLDTTHPDAVAPLIKAIDWAQTVVLLSSKSGTTREVDSLYRALRAAAEGALGTKAGRSFFVVTDPGTPLAERAQQDGFGQCFLNPPDIGGRYSALSLFGLVPAAALGANLEALLAGGAEALERLEHEVYHSQAAILAASLHAAHESGRTKLALPARAGLPFSDWLEQLLAESTGKHARGILPAVGSPGGPDRIAAGFGSLPPSPAVASPAVSDLHALGAAVATWESATALFGHLAGIDPFDEPNVQESKENTEKVLKESGGKVPAPREVGRPEDLVLGLEPPRYLAIQAYLPPSDDVWQALAELAEAVARRSGAVVTAGIGPRYLHSTGQYHKGGPAEGSFLQLYAPPKDEVVLPGLPFDLGALFAAQAEGDLKALSDRGRPVCRALLAGDPVQELRRLKDSLSLVDAHGKGR